MGLTPLPAIAARASIVAGTPVTIACDAPDGGSIDGDVLFWQYANGSVALKEAVPVIHLKPSLCLILRQPAPYYEPQAGEAFLALTHESMHIHEATIDETRVESLAIQNVWQMVRQWKFPARITRLILAQAVTTDARLPVAYHREG